jgi:hypothetical protein
MTSTDPLADLAEAGVAAWPDDLSRARLRSGNLAELARRGVVGVTTNPTIFAKALGSGSGYEEQVRDLALRGVAVGEAVRCGSWWPQTCARPATCSARSTTGPAGAEVVRGAAARSAPRARRRRAVQPSAQVSLPAPPRGGSVMCS